jgi:hypothetical protein
MSKKSLLVLTALLTMLLSSTMLAGAAATDTTDQVGGRPLTATLTGATAGVSGSAMVTVNVGQGTVCYELMVNGLPNSAIGTVSASHIHKGPAGVNGPIVVPFSQIPTNGLSNGCTTGLSKDLLKDIIQNPEMYYVNIHSSLHPAGFIRGQLSK